MPEDPARGAGEGAAGNAEPGLISRRPVHAGRVVELSVDTVRFPDGSTGELEMIRHSGAAAVLPFLDAPSGPDPRVLLLRQYRYAVGGYLVEVPAGRPDRPGEEWAACARRELEEETGRVAGRLSRLTTIFTTPGFTDEEIHIFAAWELGEGRLRTDRDEFLEPLELRLSDALERVGSGEIRDAKTICALLHAARFPFD